MDHSSLIDSRNIELWNKLNAIHKIEIQIGYFDLYSVFSKDCYSTISVPIKNQNPALFTHELLHILLWTKGVYIGAGINLSVNGSSVLPSFFPTKLIDHVGNCLDHIKMFPEFIKLGYDRSDFISDYYEDVLLEMEILKLKNNFSINGFFGRFYNSLAIEYYIGKYFSAKSCTNESFDYTEKLEKLKVINSDLYQILETFLNSWNNFDIDKIEPIYNDYHSIVYDLKLGLEKWSQKKKFINCYR